MNADNWPDRLLAGMQGWPCRDGDTGVDGVWLPRRAWDNLASIARGSPMAHGYALGAQHLRAAQDAYEQTEHGARATDAASDPMMPNDQHNRTPRSGGPG